MRRVLPSGLVTFVFTDIEGSTRLIRRVPELYVAALGRHHEIVRGTIARFGGVEVNTDGDSFFLAFADGSAAVSACAEIQRALHAEPWDNVCALRVRIGIHSGLAAPQGDDYVALAVHQAARVVAVAHGGQIVLTPDVLDTAPPPGLTARSLGKYRVRDFDQPLELLQLEATYLPFDFPALRVLPADYHNLYPPEGTFLGRDVEMHELAGAIAPGRLVTVVGPGGIGKTRLVVELGLRIYERWPDGVWFVDLASIDEPTAVLPTITATVGASVGSAVDPLDALIDHLAARQALLLLDNAEHLRDVVARIAHDLVRRAPSSGVVVTSRERLGCPGETLVRIGSLFSGGDAARSPAVQLFCERAARAAPGWSPSTHELEVIAELCAQLDGLPLAIEMAAARSGALRPADIMAALVARPDRLSSKDPTADERHRSLELLLEWSESRLTDDERSALLGLGVFAGSFGYDTARAALSGDVATDDVPDLLWALVDKSLIFTEPAAEATRYRLLHTVRSFVRGRTTAEQRRVTALRLAAHIDELVGPERPLDQVWFGRMADELDTVRGLVFLLAETDTALAQRLAWSVATFFDMQHSTRAAIAELQGHAALLLAPTPEGVGLLTRLADLHLRVGQLEEADTAVTSAASLQHRVGSCPWDDVCVERTRGELLVRRLDFRGAVELAETTLARSPSRWGQRRLANLLGIACGEAGDEVDAAHWFARELELSQELNMAVVLPSVHANLAEILLRVGDERGAAREQLACLTLSMQYGQSLMVAFSAMLAARLSALADDWQTAAQLQIAAEQLLDQLGEVLYSSDRAAADELLDGCCAHLGESAVDELQRAPLPLDATIELSEDVLKRVATNLV